MKSLKIILTALVSFFVVSCAQQETWTSLKIAEHLLSFPPGYYSDIVQIDNRIIGFTVNRLPPEKRISFAYEGDKEVTPFNPQDDPKCTHYSEFEVNDILSDGRLGLIKECYDDSGATSWLSTNRSIFAYDWHTKELERLVSGKLTQGYNPNHYTWNPDMTLGVQETGPGYPGTLYWIKPEGMIPMDIEIEDRGLTWNLKDTLDGDERAGTARHPGWSPDGKTIAFFVTTYGMRENPTPRYNVVYDMFFMDPATLKPVLELSDIADAHQIAWSPSNKYLMFSACVGRKLTCGLWRYKISDKTLSLIKAGQFSDYIWITDQKVVAANIIDLPMQNNEVWEYIISE